MNQQESLPFAPHNSGPPRREPSAVVKTRRLLNRWSIFGLLFLCSLAVIFFVSNAITVNRLVVEIDQLKDEQEKVSRQNELLRAEIIRLQSPDRIAEIARTRLRMIQAPQPPKPVQ